MVDDLDVVAVGVEHEGPVVAGVVVGALAGRAVVAVPAASRGRWKRVDGASSSAGKARWTCSVTGRRPPGERSGRAGECACPGNPVTRRNPENGAISRRTPRRARRRRRAATGGRGGRRPHRAVVHRFGGVPVGIAQEGAVVVVAVLRAAAPESPRRGGPRRARPPRRRRRARARARRRRGAARGWADARRRRARGRSRPTRRSVLAPVSWIPSVASSGA